MTSPRTLLTTLLAAGAVALVAPGIAGAETICVHVAPNSTPCDTFEPDLQAALDAATDSLAPTTVSIGNASFVDQGPFVYPNGATLADNTIAIKGVGQARPILTAPAGSTVLELNTGSAEGINVRLPSSASGIGIDAAFATLRDIQVSGPGPDSVGAQGIRAHDEVHLDDVEVTGTGSVGLEVPGGNNTVDATRLRVSNTSFGAGVNDDAQLQLSRSKLSARDVALGSRGNATVSASVLETTAPDAIGVRGGEGAVALDHVTLAHRGQASSGAALEIHPVDFGGQADLSSVVIAGYSHGLRRDTSEGGFHYPITIRDSVWDPSHDVIVDVPNSGGISEDGNAHVDPALVDLASGDFRLRGSSAAVDRDTRTDLRYEDVNGGGLVDGDANGSKLADAGALEYRRIAPSIETADVPGAGTTGQALTFGATGTDPDGDRLQFAWDLGDGAVGSGAQSVHAYTAPGIYTVTLHVTDEAGLGATRTFSVAVSAAAAAGGATTAGGAGGGAASDLIAPKLSKVGLSKARLSKTRLRARSTSALALRFTLSERATVRVTVGGVKIVKTLSAGRRSIGLTKALRRAKSLRLGRLAVKITATDAAGNRSAPRKVALRIVA